MQAPSLGFLSLSPLAAVSRPTPQEPSVAVSSLWCTASGSLQCTAWGSNTAGEPIIQSLAGGSWTTEPTTGLAAGESYGTCMPSGSCIAFESLASGGVAVLTQASATSAWTGSVLAGPPNGTLLQVSCTAKLCAGVGTYYDDTAHEHTMLFSLSHGSWVEQTLNSVPSVYTDFPSISCQIRTCFLVDGDTVTTNSGDAWTTTTLPEPTGDTSFLSVDSVSCISARWCVAVGTPNGFGENAVIETYSGGTWTAQEAPLPSGADANLQDVSCTSETSCVIVGTGSPSANTGIQSFVETLSGTSWVPSYLPPVSGATYGQLESVSCPASGSCTAVGSWFPEVGGEGDPLLATSSGGTWTQAAVPPSGGQQFWQFHQRGLHRHEQVLRGRERGGCSDTAHPSGSRLGCTPRIPLPAGAASVSPEAISCVSGSAWCTLAGYYDAPVSGSPGPATYPMIAATGAPPFAFTSASVARAVVGTPFTFEVETTSTPGDALSATGLPAGFTFENLGHNTAAISGTAALSEVGTTARHHRC